MLRHMVAHVVQLFGKYSKNQCTVKEQKDSAPAGQPGMAVLPFAICSPDEDPDDKLASTQCHHNITELELCSLLAQSTAHGAA